MKDPPPRVAAHLNSATADPIFSLLGPSPFHYRHLLCTYLCSLHQAVLSLINSRNHHYWEVTGGELFCIVSSLFPLSSPPSPEEMPRQIEFFSQKSPANCISPAQISVTRPTQWLCKLQGGQKAFLHIITDIFTLRHCIYLIPGGSKTLSTSAFS